MYRVCYLTGIFGDGGFDAYPTRAEAEAAAEEFAAGLADAYPNPAAGWDGWERRDGLIIISGALYLPHGDAEARQLWDNLDWQVVEEPDEDDREGDTGVWTLSEAEWRAAIARYAVWVEVGGLDDIVEVLLVDIRLADTLDELAAALNALADHDPEVREAVEDRLDMTSLPTFGGPEPADTTGVWSWDETRLLVGASQPFRMVPR